MFKISELFNNNINIDEDYNKDEIFKLPLFYLENNDLYDINPIILDDLELVNNNEITKTTDVLPIYDYLLEPKHNFGKNMINKWKLKYTNNISYLNDSKFIISNFQLYKPDKCNNSDCDDILVIWNNIKNDEFFLEKYNYIDFNILKHLNESSRFLQCYSIINLLSPLISLIVPIILLILPFILLKIQGIHISLSAYIESLKFLGKNHFMGKALFSLETINIQTVSYVFIMFGLYLFQMYQNSIMCYRFYNNIHKINTEMMKMKNFVSYSISSMNSFYSNYSSLVSYKPFFSDFNIHLSKLILLQNEINDIEIYNNLIHKFSNIGYLLKSYYLIFSNIDYEKSIIYSMEFEGYIDNLTSIHNHYINQNISLADFNNNNTCKLKDQYYPPLINDSPIKNNCNLNKNMIISAPNKSGKTTILKTTAINIIFSQQFGCGFYSSATITPFTHIHSYINIPDTSSRDSLFQAESRRCKDIIDIINNTDSSKRHFCIFDELYSGTNPTEASLAGIAFLQYLQQFKNVKFILTTHYTSICKKYKNSDKIENYKMDVKVSDDDIFEYKYKLKKGISYIKGAIRVLKDLNYPAEIINNIR